MKLRGIVSVKKIHKRLWIVVFEDDQEWKLYTPPDHVQLPDRGPLQELARLFDEKRVRDIAAIIEFETKYKRKKR